MYLTDEYCDRLCEAAKEKNQECSALILSITLVPGKTYTAAITQCKTKDVASNV
ncbi:hypothetical protein BN3662_00194 [Clostridiales bacterium CHKCI006]|nr:hypothetical protein BN3662_00194 [Clostridiales bacterium CHKCI006]